MKLWFPAGVEMLSARVRRNKADTARKDAAQSLTIPKARVDGSVSQYTE